MSEAALALTLLGRGLWARGYADPAAYLAQQADLSGQDPRAELLPARLRRRTSLLTRMAAEVVAQAIAGAGVDLKELVIVFGSVYGEIQATVDLLAQMVDEPGAPLSPAKFHNSVHNTATGYLSIATGSHAGATAVSAGAATLAVALLEAATALAACAAPILVVLAEEPLPEPLAQGQVYAPLAAALLLGPAGMPGPQLRLRLAPAPLPAWRALPAAAGDLAANPCAAALGLIELLARGERGDFLLPSERSGPAFALGIEPDR